MQKDGEEGRKKIQEYTRYTTVGLALLESSAMAIGFGRQGLLLDYNAWNVIVAIVTMTTGSALLMWIGEQITDKGVGNGISIVLLFNILSSCLLYTSIGVVGNGEHSLINIGKAGRTRHMGIRPTVRGSVMNPNDHPHGGGDVYKRQN